MSALSALCARGGRYCELLLAPQEEGADSAEGSQPAADKGSPPPPQLQPRRRRLGAELEYYVDAVCGDDRGGLEAHGGARQPYATAAAALRAARDTPVRPPVALVARYTLTSVPAVHRC